MLAHVNENETIFFNVFTKFVVDRKNRFRRVDMLYPVTLDVLNLIIVDHYPVRPCQTVENRLDHVIDVSSAVGLIMFLLKAPQLYRNANIAGEKKRDICSERPDFGCYLVSTLLLCFDRCWHRRKLQLNLFLMGIY